MVNVVGDHSRSQKRFDAPLESEIDAVAGTVSGWGGGRLPDRPVIGIQADGSAMYTICALWSYARERCDVTTIVSDNGSYAILEHELSRVGRRGTASRPGGCSTTAGRTWTSWRSRRGWVGLPPARRRRRNRPTSCGRHWPSRART